MKRMTVLTTMLMAAFALAACGESDEQTVSETSSPQPAADKPLPEMSGTSPGKPSAPISIRYEIMSKPVVGQPVLINVMVDSAEGPVEVHYSITDRSALVFQDGQVERLEIRDPSRRDVPRQLSVVPQREGRLYVNVSARVQTPTGAMVRSMAIPIKVGAAPAEAASNGEVVEGPDGEAVISLPAKETTEN